jgi:predicted glycoside hydrolase/deacetylase ChbG (UPF0249 family)
MKRLIVNADDLGLSRSVNQGIEETARQGCVRSATVLCDAPAFEEGIALLRDIEGVGIGIHLNLTGAWAAGRGERRGFFTGRPGPLLRACITGRIDEDFVEKHFTEQFESFLKTGLTPTHFDGHHHVHVFPRIAALAVRIAKSFGIFKARLPLESWSVFKATPGALGVRLTVGALARWAAPLYRKNGIRVPDRFLGFGLMNSDDYPQRLARSLECVEDGWTELMVHPGGPEQGDALDEYSAGRVEERSALCDPATLDALAQQEIELVSFADLE